MSNTIQKVLDVMNRDRGNGSSRDEKMTLEKLGKLLGVSKQTIINWEKDPAMIPSGKLKELSKLSGLTADVLMASEDDVIPGPALKPTFEISTKHLREAIVNLREGCNQIAAIAIPIDYKALGKLRTGLIEELSDLADNAELQSRKPRVCALGMSDTGKSTIANFLLSEQVTPVGYTPLTSVIVYLHYISDKPEYLSGAQDTVVIGRSTERGTMSDDKIPFDVYRDEDIGKQYILNKGEHKAILTSYGTRDGAFYEDESVTVDSIHVFLDNPFLKEVDYIDNPGYGSGDINDDVSLNVKMYQSDFIFYLSTGDAFFRGTEMSLLCDIISARVQSPEDLGCVYIVATHADSIGDPEKVDKILKGGVTRLIKSMSQDQLEALGDNPYKALYDRCFGFDISNERYCNALKQDIEGRFPGYIQKKAEKASEDLCRACNTYEEVYRKNIEDIDEELDAGSDDVTEALAEQEAIAKDKIEEIRKRLKKSIMDHSEQCQEEFGNLYDSKINESAIEKALKDRKVKNRKNDINDFTTWLGNELNSGFKRVMSKHSKQFSSDVNASIEDYRAVWSEAFTDDAGVEFEGIDFERAFAAGLGGLATYGALAVWATVAAAGSNLGGYILVAQVASWLGINPILATTTVAALGGPVGIGIALAVIVAVGIFTALSASWRPRLAKKIVKAYEKENSRNRYVNEIRSVWEDDTLAAVNSCLDSMHEKSVDYFETAIEIRTSDYRDKTMEIIPEVYGTACDTLFDISDDLDSDKSVVVA